MFMMFVYTSNISQNESAMLIIYTIEEYFPLLRTQNISSERTQVIYVGLCVLMYVITVLCLASFTNLSCLIDIQRLLSGYEKNTHIDRKAHSHYNYPLFTIIHRCHLFLS